MNDQAMKSRRHRQRFQPLSDTCNFINDDDDDDDWAEEEGKAGVMTMRIG